VDAPRPLRMRAGAVPVVVGLRQPSDAQHVEHCLLSVNRRRQRKRGYLVTVWMLDSGHVPSSSAVATSAIVCRSPQPSVRAETGVAGFWLLR